MCIQHRPWVNCCRPSVPPAPVQRVWQPLEGQKVRTVQTSETEAGSKRTLQPEEDSPVCSSSILGAVCFSMLKGGGGRVGKRGSEMENGGKDDNAVRASDPYSKNAGNGFGRGALKRLDASDASPSSPPSLSRPKLGAVCRSLRRPSKSWRFGT